MDDAQQMADDFQQQKTARACVIVLLKGRYPRQLIAGGQLGLIDDVAVP